MSENVTKPSTIDVSLMAFYVGGFSYEGTCCDFFVKNCDMMGNREK
jgi:hypothetical protein